MPLIVGIILGCFLLFAIFQNVHISVKVDRLKTQESVLKQIILTQSANTRKIHNFVQGVLDNDELKNEELEDARKKYLDIVKSFNKE